MKIWVKFVYCCFKLPKKPPPSSQNPGYAPAYENGKVVEGGKWIKGRDGRIGFSQENQCKIWKEHMERIMNEENAWDHKVDAAMVEGPVEKVSRKEGREAIRKMKHGKAVGLSEVITEMIVAGGRIAEEVMLQLCQRVLNGKGIPEEWKTSNAVTIFREKEM